MTLVNLTSPKKRQVDPWIGNIFDSIFNDTVVPPSRFSNPVPAVNIAETASGYEIDLAAPGLKKEDFKINLEKHELTISVEKKETSKEDGKKFSKQEFSYYSFSRKFIIPETVDETSISASYKDGILQLKLAKKEEEINSLKVIDVK